MTAKKLEALIHRQIPLSKKMGIRVLGASVEGGVRFGLPLGPNRNHKNTAFGGTLVAAQALASWAWVMMLLERKKIQAEVVLQRQAGEFKAPVTADFYVKTIIPSPPEIRAFLKALKGHRKGSVTMRAQITVVGGGNSCMIENKVMRRDLAPKNVLANFSGQYVAILS